MKKTLLTLLTPILVTTPVIVAISCNKTTDTSDIDLETIYHALQAVRDIAINEDISEITETTFSTNKENLLKNITIKIEDLEFDMSFNSKDSKNEQILFVNVIATMNNKTLSKTIKITGTKKVNDSQIIVDNVRREISNILKGATLVSKLSKTELDSIVNSNTLDNTNLHTTFLDANNYTQLDISNVALNSASMSFEVIEVSKGIVAGAIYKLIVTINHVEAVPKTAEVFLQSSDYDNRSEDEKNVQDVFNQINITDPGNISIEKFDELLNLYINENSEYVIFDGTKDIYTELNPSLPSDLKGTEVSYKLTTKSFIEGTKATYNLVIRVAKGQVNKETTITLTSSEIIPHYHNDITQAIYSFGIPRSTNTISSQVLDTLVIDDFAPLTESVLTSLGVEAQFKDSADLNGVEITYRLRKGSKIGGDRARYELDFKFTKRFVSSTIITSVASSNILGNVAQDVRDVRTAMGVPTVKNPVALHELDLLVTKSSQYHSYDSGEADALGLNYASVSDTKGVEIDYKLTFTSRKVNENAVYQLEIRFKKDGQDGVANAQESIFMNLLSKGNVTEESNLAIAKTTLGGKTFKSTKESSTLRFSVSDTGTWSAFSTIQSAIGISSADSFNLFGVSAHYNVTGVTIADKTSKIGDPVKTITFELRLSIGDLEEVVTMTITSNDLVTQNYIDKSETEVVTKEIANAIQTAIPSGIESNNFPTTITSTTFDDLVNDFAVDASNDNFSSTIDSLLSADITASFEIINVVTSTTPGEPVKTITVEVTIKKGTQSSTINISIASSNKNQ